VSGGCKCHSSIGGANSAPPNTLAGLRGNFEVREKRGKGKRERNRKEGKGRQKTSHRIQKTSPK